MKEQRAFNSTVEKKSMFLESTKLHYRPTKIEKRLLCYKLVQMGSRQYSIDTVHVWQKQIIGIFQTNFVQYGSSNRDITRTESQGEKLGCDQ